MSRAPRFLGIVVGLLAGTIAALSFRGNPAKFDSQPSTGSSVINVEVEDAENSEPTLSDPGQRRSLRTLVQGAKQEENWLKEFELTERSGRQVTSQDLRGEPYVACFFFSTCPGTCTRQSSKMQLLQNKFRGKSIRFVSITVDPEIDTPDVLSEYADRFEADKDRWLFLTGRLDYIVRVGTEKFFLGGVEKRGHPDRFCLVNAEGDIVGAYTWKDLDEFEQLLAHMNELLTTPSTTRKTTN
jgi:cytochrome oxidase Cu insertion factor (SCO1/SenC/PrrC family)